MKKRNSREHLFGNVWLIYIMQIFEFLKFISKCFQKGVSHFVFLFFIISSLRYYRVFVTWIFSRLFNLYLKALNLEFNLITQDHGVFVIIFSLIEWLIKLLMLLCYRNILYIKQFTILSFCHISSLVEVYMIVIGFSFCPLIGAWELADFTVVVTVTSFFCNF